MNRVAPSSPLVSVVIPNWNGLTFLKMVLPSLRKQTLKDFETIVVDNGSDDGSAAYVRKHHPAVKLIALDENCGFAIPCNAGMKAARGKFIALINNDLELDPKWLAEMTAAMRRYPHAGSLACKMMQYDRRRYIDEAGGLGSWHGVFYPRGRGEQDTGQYDDETSVLYGSGGAVLYRRKALDQAGLLDEDLFAYLEDVDLGFRLQLAGWSCEYIPTAVVYHVGGGTNRRLSGFSQRHWARNTRIVVLKDYPFWALVRYAPKLLYAEAKMFAGAVRDDWFKVYLHALAGVLRHLPRTLAKRWKIQRRRVATRRYLDSVIGRKFPPISKGKVA